MGLDSAVHESSRSNTSQQSNQESNMLCGLGMYFRKCLVYFSFVLASLHASSGMLWLYWGPNEGYVVGKRIVLLQHRSSTIFIIALHYFHINYSELTNIW